VNSIKSTSKKIVVALAAASAVMVGVGVASPAWSAQAKDAKVEKEKPKGSLSRPFSKPVEEAQKLFKDSKFQDALNILNDADTKAGKTPYDQFVLDELRSFCYRNLQNYGEAAALAEKGMSSGFLDGQDLAVRPKLLATLYYQVKNYDKAVEFGVKGLESEPNDPTLFQIVSQGYYLKNDFPGTVKFIDGYVAKQESAGAEPSEQSLLLLRSACVKQDDNACTSKSTDRLVAHYPKAEYWQQAVDPLMRTKSSDAVLFNVYRLALAVGTMQKPDDYFEFADLALRAGSPGEAQTALDDGNAKGVFGDAKSKERLKTVQASVSEQVKSDQASLEKIAKDADASKVGQKDIGLGVAYLGYKQYDKAVESFKKGLAKPGVMNVPEANLLLGISALRAGKKDEAQTAFKAVKGDAQLERIATLWSLHAAKA
jgi:tetratricopeptide (TPR) repeat protein